MKKFYLGFLMVFALVGYASAQLKAPAVDNSRLWVFGTWTSLANPDATTEGWRGAGATVTVVDVVPQSADENDDVNASEKVLKFDVSATNGGLVFERIDPAFDRSVHNAVSFSFFQSAVCDWKFEMMNSGSKNQWNKTIRTEESKNGKWQRVIFEIDPTVAADLTKFVIKVHNAVSYASPFYLDSIRFFNFVKPAPKAVEITNLAEMTVGKKSTLKLVFTPQVEGGLVDKEATFVSSDPAVLTVDGTGALTAVAPGKATITVTSKADGSVTDNLEFTVKAEDPANSFMVYDFETSSYVPSHANYVYSIVANPSASGINTSAKVLSVEAKGANWQWSSWANDINPNKVSKLKFKILSTTAVDPFSVDFGVNGAGSTKVAALTANTWTEVIANLPTTIDFISGFYIFTNDKWNTGTFFVDDIMLVAGDGSGYVPVSSIGTMTDGAITAAGGKLTLTAPAVSPANASNKNFMWKIATSEPADAASINTFTGEITAKLDGTVTVKAISEDKLFEATATVTISNQASRLSKVSANTVSIYPNPSKGGVINVSDVSNIKGIRIISFAGAVVLQPEVTSTIDISSLTKGLYIVEFTTVDNVRSATKLVVE